MVSSEIIQFNVGMAIVFNRSLEVSPVNSTTHTNVYSHQLGLSVATTVENSLQIRTTHYTDLGA